MSTLDASNTSTIRHASSKCQQLSHSHMGSQKRPQSVPKVITKLWKRYYFVRPDNTPYIIHHINVNNRVTPIFYSFELTVQSSSVASLGKHPAARVGRLGVCVCVCAYTHRCLFALYADQKKRIRCPGPLLTTPCFGIHTIHWKPTKTIEHPLEYDIRYVFESDSVVFKLKYILHMHTCLCVCANVCLFCSRTFMLVYKSLQKNAYKDTTMHTCSVQTPGRTCIPAHMFLVHSQKRRMTHTLSDEMLHANKHFQTHFHKQTESEVQR